MKYRVKAKKPTGELFEAIKEAPDRYAAAREVRKEGATIISVLSTEVSPAKNGLGSITLFERVSLHERIVFAQNIAAMVTAGLSLARALSVFERQTRNQYFKKIVAGIKDTIDKGGTLSAGLALYPKVFDQVFVSMVSAGENSGTLPESLKIVGDQLEKSYALRKKVSGALMYPGVIIFAMVVIGIFMMIYVVPTLTASFAEVKSQLPLSTRMVIAVADFLSQHTFIALSTLAAVLGLAVFGLRTPLGKRFRDTISLRLPVVAPLTQEAQVAVLARTISSLISAGVDMVEALGITSRVVSNSYYKASLENAKIDIQKGLPLSNTFSEDSHLYPVLLGAMAEVGEETGTLPAMLMNTAVFYEAEVDAAAKNLSTIIEPVLMIVIGLAVGFFAVSMIQPLYSLTSTV